MQKFRPIFPAVVIMGLAASACSPIDFSNIDLDMRGNAPGALDTSSVARTAAEDRPKADSNGLITYPGYQIAVARRGDTLGDVAKRVGVDPARLARHNGRGVTDILRPGELLVMPERVNPATTQTADTSSNAANDIASIAGAAIDRAAPDAPIKAKPLDVQAGPEPIRHRVSRGETAFSIARLYGVSVKSLAEWNSLDSSLATREGQYLIIPLVLENETLTPVSGAVAAPGAGSTTPEPPSASAALPAPIVEAELPASPNLDQFQTAASTPTASAPKPSGSAPNFQTPVSGGTVGAFSTKKQGVDIAVSAGSTVRAAASGEVILITRDTEQQPVIVIAHDGDMKSAYANITDLRVKKGDRVRAGQPVAKVGGRTTTGLRFTILKGFEPVDPGPFLK